VETSVDKFDRLLEEMAKIAEAINAFKSEEVQRNAFDALIRALDVGDNEDDLAQSTGAEKDGQAATSDPGLATDATEDRRNGGRPTASARAQGARTRRAATKKSYTAVKDINFRPQGQVALRDFAEQKAPGSLREKNLLIVYYFEQILNLDGITVGHVLAGYRECGWRSAADPDNSLRVTSSRTGWIDTSDMKSIRTTHPGRNTVEHDMPKSRK
jgi:hypothetical protein